MARVEPCSRQRADVFRDPQEDAGQRGGDGERHPVIPPNAEPDAGAYEHQNRGGDQDVSEIKHEMMREKVDVDRDGEKGCRPKLWIGGEAHVKYADHARHE